MGRLKLRLNWAGICVCAAMLFCMVPGAYALGPDTVLPAPASFLGEGAGDLAGQDVALVGDVDGDGYDDLLVGARGADVADEGRAYLFYGKATGWGPNISLSTADAIFVGETAGDNAGLSLSGAGDVNGDGYDDFLVGAPLRDEGGSNYGKVYLFYGSPVRESGPASVGTADVTLLGAIGNSRAGSTLSGAGDVDADGYDDILIGCARHPGVLGGTQRGRVYLILGGAGLASDTLSNVGGTVAGTYLVGEFDSDRAAVVAGAGDVDNDGYDDFLVGAPLNDEGGTGAGNAGQAYLFLGDSPLPWAVGDSMGVADASFLGQADLDQAGEAVAGAGDVNGDGYDDILIGARYSSEVGLNAGETHLILGKASGWAMDTPLSSADASYRGEFINDNAGESVGGSGDVNGDGYDDFVIGAPGNDEGGADAGQVYLILGKSSGWAQNVSLAIADASFIGSSAGDRAGIDLGMGLPAFGCADVNGDDYHDIIIGADGADLGAGEVYLVLSDYAPPPPECGICIPDTLVFYADTVKIPVWVTEGCCDLVSYELDIEYENRVANPGAPRVDPTGALTELWHHDDNIILGPAGTDTLLAAGATTTDSASCGPVLVYLNMITEDIRHPDSTQLDLIRNLLNDVPIPVTCTGWLKLRGYTAVIDTDPDSIYPAETVTITVNDPDEDRNTAGMDSVMVWAYRQDGADSEFVKLYAPAGGVFVNTLPTVFSLGAGVVGDGQMSVSAGDTIFACYYDSLNDWGNSGTVCAFTEVIGGEDGTFDVTYVVQSFTDRGGLRDTIRVRLADADEDGAASLPVVMVGQNPPDVENLVLPSTSPIFEIRVPTVRDLPDADDDGIMPLSTTLGDLDTIVTTYIDSLGEHGGVDTVEALTYVINIFGDVSKNDRIGAYDAHFVLAFAVGLEVASFRDSLAADVSGENQIIAWDASLILQWFVRIIDRFPVHEYVKTDTTGPKNHPFLKAIGGDMVSFGAALPQSDGTYLVPLTLTDRSGILSGTLNLGHDSGMEIVNVTTADGYEDYLLAYNPESEGVRIAFAGAQSDMSGSGEVIWLRVRGSDDTPLQFTLDKAALNGMYMPVSSALLEVEVAKLPETYALHQNVPNPFNPETAIRYDVPSGGHVSLVVYNVMGQTVRELMDGHQEAGHHQVMWDGKDALGRDVGSGMYMLKMKAEGFADTRKMLLLR